MVRHEQGHTLTLTCVEFVCFAFRLAKKKRSSNATARLLAIATLGGYSRYLRTRVLVYLFSVGRALR
jgi:hypothetical protein